PGAPRARLEPDEDLARASSQRAAGGVAASVKARIKLVEGITFVAESGSGHAIVVDASPDVGGRDLGARPMELVLMGTGACSAVDVVLILRRSRQAIVDCFVELDADRAPEDPKVFTRIHFHYVVTGKQLSASHVERAIRL